MHGYLSAVQRSDSNLYLSTLRSLLTTENTAWLGATIALRSDYDDGLFVLCLDALEKGWIAPALFSVLRYGKAIESVPPEKTGRLFNQLNEYGTQDASALLIELLDSVPFNDSSLISSGFVLGVVSRSIPGEEGRDFMRGYHWKHVCTKLVKWDETRTLPLLDTLLTGMGRTYNLTYDSNVAPLANELVQANPTGTWTIVRTHLEETLPKRRGDLLHWLKGGLATFDEKDPRGAVINLPVPEILEWIEKDPEPRAALMAHAVPGTLDENQGGRLTQELLSRYGQLEGVRNGISATFHSGGWSGPTSAYLKRKRDKLRRWLTAGFDSQTVQWIEAEIEHLDRSIEREEIDEERSRFE